MTRTELWTAPGSTGVPARELDRNGLEVLGRQECLELLATSSLGRVGFTSGALPVILPVNFRLVDDDLVFRTGQGTKLDAATRGAVVAFEVDRFEPFSHAGWSVTVTGMAREVTDPGELERIERAGVPRWAPSADERVVAVSTQLVSGRRIVVGRRPPDGGPARMAPGDDRT